MISVFSFIVAGAVSGLLYAKWAMWIHARDLRIALSHVESLIDLAICAASDLERAGHPETADEYRRALDMRGKGDWV